MDENYSLQQEQREYEIDSNPELQRNELNPSVAKVMYSHEKVYKTLATVGDFVCHIWYYDDNYDPQRSTEGSKRIHIVPTDNILKHDTDSKLVNYWFNIANDKWPQGVIFVNPIIRRNGVKFVSNYKHLGTRTCFSSYSDVDVVPRAAILRTETTTLTKRFFKHTSLLNILT